MKKGEYVTKNPDEFTKGLVDVIHDYFEKNGRPLCIKENTMVEVSHAILSEYEFRVERPGKMSMDKYVPAETLYCGGDALVAMLETARANNEKEFSMRIEPNPYAMVNKQDGVKTAMKTEKLPAGKGQSYKKQTTIRTGERPHQKSNHNRGGKNGYQHSRKPERSDRV